ncbi:MAG: hypothetical protein ACKOOF_07070, partial [Planctomycetaceae bacterium]
MKRRTWIAATCLLAVAGPVATAGETPETARREKPLALPSVATDTVAAIQVRRCMGVFPSG